MATIRTATLDPDGRVRLTLAFADEAGRQATKAAGARWDPTSKAWVLPVSASTARLTEELHVLADDALRAALDEVAGEPEAPVRLVAHRGRIEIEFPYDPKLKDEIKSAGARWDKEARVWWVPLAQGNEWVRLAGKSGWAIAASVSTALDELDDAAVASRATEVDTDLDLPASFDALHPYQRAGVAYVELKRRALIADEMGLGKSSQALAAVAAAGAWPAVVICPTSLRLVWEAEIGKWLPGRSSCVVTGRSSKLPDAYGYTDLVIVGYDVLAARLADLRSLHPQSLVLDEIHYCKERSSQRTKAALKLASSIPHDGLVLGLTGTPILSRPSELVQPLRILGTLEQISPSTKAFLDYYCDGHETDFGYQAKGASNTAELHTNLRRTCMVRRTKKDVMSELPALTVAPVPLVVPPADAAPRSEAENTLLELLAGEAHDDGWEERCANPDGSILAALTAARQAAGLAKINSGCSWLEELLDTGEKVIVWAHHIEVQKAIASHFGESAAWLKGGQKREDAMAEAERFQVDEDCRVMVASLSAAREGWTLTAATHAVFLEEPWRPSDVDQAAARCYGRASDPHGATAWHLHDPSSYLDGYMLELVAKKAGIVAAVTDGALDIDAGEVGTRTAVLRALTRHAIGADGVVRAA